MIDLNIYSNLEKKTEVYISGENRGRQNELWHTAIEDYHGCAIAGILLKKFNLPCVDISYIRKLFDGLVYPKSRLSIPVAHDVDIYNSR